MGFSPLLRRERSHDEAGASATEYGLLVAAIATVIVIVAFGLGGVVRNLFDNSCGEIHSAMTSVTSTCS